MLADGRGFEDVRELKALLLEDEDAVARNLIVQLSIYAPGAPVRFSDREKVEDILNRARENDFGVRDIILLLIQSELFLNK